MPTNPENTTDVDVIAIRHAADDFLAAYNAADIDRVCALLTEGALLMPPNEPAIAGLELVRSRIDCFFSGFNFTMRFNAAHTEVAGNIAFERGAYTAFAILKGESGDPRGGYGEYLLLFERQKDRSWRIAAFGTAPAQGVPPASIVAPERLAAAIEQTDDPEALYWRDRWAEKIAEHLSYPEWAEIRRMLDNLP
jgi:ketosteroid isomerase-like protein